MSAAQARSKRLARVLALRRAALRAVEARLAAAGAQARAADARVTQVQALVAGAGVSPGDAGLAGLRAGATLRALLHPALEAATQQAAAARQSRSDIGLELAEAEARHRRAGQDAAVACEAAETEREDREAADRPARASHRRPA
jgi:hypothetical protein